MAEPNDLLRQTRERTESPNSSGDCLSRQELAELVNAWVFDRTGRTVELDANYIAKLEQGRIRWVRDNDRGAGLPDARRRGRPTPPLRRAAGWLPFRCAAACASTP